jgi:hypothetical protein
MSAVRVIFQAKIFELIPCSVQLPFTFQILKLPSNHFPLSEITSWTSGKVRLDNYFIYLILCRFSHVGRASCASICMLKLEGLIIIVRITQVPSVRATSAPRHFIETLGILPVNHSRINCPFYPILINKIFEKFRLHLSSKLFNISVC